MGRFSPGLSGEDTEEIGPAADIVLTGIVPLDLVGNACACYRASSTTQEIICMYKMYHSCAEA
jgi:hypothetical protein